MANYITASDISEWGDEDDGLALIKKLIEIGAMAKEESLWCPNGHVLFLGADVSRLDNYRWRCNQSVMTKYNKKRRCVFTQNIRTHTFFADSTLSLIQMCTIIQMWTHNVSLKSIAKKVQISDEIAGQWAASCREVLEYALIENKKKIGGPNKPVEIFEALNWRRKHLSGLQVKGQWVFGFFEQETGVTFIVPVESNSLDTLYQIIQEWIEPDTIILSDSWETYNRMNHEGLKKLKINFEDPNFDTISEYRKASKTREKFIGGYMAKHLFLKQCLTGNLDPFVEFFNYSAKLYNPMNPVHVEDIEATLGDTENNLEDLENDGEDNTETEDIKKVCDNTERNLCKS